MASEDSDELVPGFLVIHRLGDPCDLDETVGGSVPTRLHYLHARREALEIKALRRPERMLLEERDDPFHQVIAPGHDVLAQVLLVIVMALVDVDPADPEELTELLEAASTARTLRHDKRVAHLIAGLVASSARAVSLPHETDREASFSIYKADDPTTELAQPFLLIFRTRHVVTVDAHSDITSSAGYTGFPAYSQMHTAPLPVRGAAKCLQGHRMSFSATLP